MSFVDLHYVMNINELKKLIKNSTSVLILDEGEPSFVVLNYNTYRDLTGEKSEVEKVSTRQSSRESVFGGQSIREKETEILERLNKEILALKAQIETEEKGLSSSELDSIQGLD
jgi:hypothetical protein